MKSTRNDHNIEEANKKFLEKWARNKRLTNHPEYATYVGLSEQHDALTIEISSNHKNSAKIQSAFLLELDRYVAALKKGVYADVLTSFDKLGDIFDQLSAQPIPNTKPMRELTAQLFEVYRRICAEEIEEEFILSLQSAVDSILALIQIDRSIIKIIVEGYNDIGNALVEGNEKAVKAYYEKHPEEIQKCSASLEKLQAEQIKKEPKEAVSSQQKLAVVVNQPSSPSKVDKKNEPHAPSSPKLPSRTKMGDHTPPSSRSDSEEKSSDSEDDKDMSNKSNPIVKKAPTNPKGVPSQIGVHAVKPRQVAVQKSSAQQKEAKCLIM